jgi:hypothetical protein
MRKIQRIFGNPLDFENPREKSAFVLIFEIQRILEIQRISRNPLDFCLT